jgi:hypothetical protein
LHPAPSVEGLMQVPARRRHVGPDICSVAGEISAYARRDDATRSCDGPCAGPSGCRHALPSGSGRFDFARGGLVRRVVVRLHRTTRQAAAFFDRSRGGHSRRPLVFSLEPRCHGLCARVLISPFGGRCVAPRRRQASWQEARQPPPSRHLDASTPIAASRVGRPC